MYHQARTMALDGRPSFLAAMLRAVSVLFVGYMRNPDKRSAVRSLQKQAAFNTPKLRPGLCITSCEALHRQPC